MKIGVPKEVKDNEKRVSITPYGVANLIESGNAVYVQENSGIGSGFSNDDYKNSGATLLDNPEDIFLKSDMIVKVKEPQVNEIKMIKPNQILFTYFHFAADKVLTESIIKSSSIAIAYETVQMENGQLPLVSFFDIARDIVQKSSKIIKSAPFILSFSSSEIELRSVK